MHNQKLRSPGGIRGLAWSILFAGQIVGTASAAPAKPDHVQDLMLTVLARRALLDDRELGPFNLGVMVNNRVATVWGNVPSPIHVDRAIRTLSRMTDVVRVENAMQIAVDEESLPVSTVAPELPFGPPATLTNGVVLGKPAAPTAKKPTPAPLPGSDSAWQAVRPREDPRMPGHREFETVLPSLRLPTPIIDPAVLALTRAIEKSVNELRQQPRFNGIDVKVKDAVVTLTGDPTPALYDFAHAVSHVPGVGRVIVKERQ